jgi:D-alanyl-D-alanine carboxypeptidase
VDVGLDLAGHLASARSLPARLERCQALVDGLVAAGLPGASAAVVLPDGELHTFVAGNTQREGGRPLTPADRLLVGSTGKTFVTAVAHRLLADGLLELDAPIADLYADEPHPPAWLDTLAGAREFTLRQLLRHETGLARYVYVEDFHRTLSSEPDRVWKPEELVAFVADAPPLFAPGEGWAYSDTNYLVVGMLIEHVTGRTFYDLTQEHVLEPLALNDTVPTDSRSIPGLVQGEVIGGRTLGVGEWLLEDGQATYNLQFEWCGGGFASTPADLARWAAALFGGRALAGDDDGAYLGTLLDAVDAPGLWPGTRYGLGVMLRDSAAGPMQFHDGFMPGHLTTLAWYPELGVGAALQVNTDDARALGRPRFEILAELAKTAITPP